MKYAVLFFILIFSNNIFSNSEINHLKDSEAIMQIMSFMHDNREDLVSIYHLSEQKISNVDLSKCNLVKSDSIAIEFKKSFKVILNKFPDEELPFAEAYNDMKSFLGKNDYYRCVLSDSIYYQSNDGMKFFKMDNVAPLY